ncbi:MAG: HNH endonuclease signature motif containing protein [Anaeromyxobacteraceae bacterium]
MKDDSRSTVELGLARTLVEPLTPRETRMHVTVSPEFLALLKKAKAGESHRNPGATDEQVLTAALELLVAHQEKRRASVPPKVKREVLKRDGGKCAWPLANGGTCGSEVRTEIDHVVPRGRGGPSTVDNCRVLCDVHNREAARQVYGDAHMDLFAPRAPRASEPVAESELPPLSCAPLPAWRRSYEPVSMFVPWPRSSPAPATAWR